MDVYESCNLCGAAQTAVNVLWNEGCNDCPAWAALADNVLAPDSAKGTGPSDWPHGWQFHCMCRVLPRLRFAASLGTSPPGNPAGQQAAAWPTAVPANRATALPPEVMQIALRRRLRLRLRLPLGPAICGQEGHGCGRRLHG